MVDWVPIEGSNTADTARPLETSTIAPRGGERLEQHVRHQAEGQAGNEIERHGSQEGCNLEGLGGDRSAEEQRQPEGDGEAPGSGKPLAQIGAGRDESPDAGHGQHEAGQWFSAEGEIGHVGPVGLR